MTDSFPKLMTYTKPQIQEDQKTPHRVEKQEQKPLHLSMLYSKCRKSKTEKILKETRRKNTLTYKGTRVTIIKGFATEMTQMSE